MQLVRVNHHPPPPPPPPMLLSYLHLLELGLLLVGHIQPRKMLNLDSEGL